MSINIFANNNFDSLLLILSEQICESDDFVSFPEHITWAWLFRPGLNDSFYSYPYSDLFYKSDFNSYFEVLAMSLQKK